MKLPLFAYEILVISLIRRLPYLRSRVALLSCNSSLLIANTRSGPLPPGSGPLFRPTTLSGVESEVTFRQRGAAA